MDMSICSAVKEGLKETVRNPYARAMLVGIVSLIGTTIAIAILPTTGLAAATVGAAVLAAKIIKIAAFALTSGSVGGFTATLFTTSSCKRGLSFFIPALIAAGVGVIWLVA